MWASRVPDTTSQLEGLYSTLLHFLTQPPAKVVCFRSLQKQQCLLQGLLSLHVGLAWRGILLVIPALWMLRHGAHKFEASVTTQQILDMPGMHSKTLLESVRTQCDGERRSMKEKLTHLCLKDERLQVGIEGFVHSKCQTIGHLSSHLSHLSCTVAFKCSTQLLPA